MVDVHQPTQIDLNTVPNLPGFGFKRKPKSHLKAQTFNYCNGLPIEQKEGVTHERPKLVKCGREPEQARQSSFPETTHAEEFKQPLAQPHSELPAWDVLDRHVLRFYGYFKEGVVETNLENYRVRNCTILYYLEDDTCQLNEKRVDNSGMPQGQLIRRHRLPGPDGGYLKWDHLMVGTDIHIYGRVIRIFDCDPWTRSYFQSHGIEQGMPEPSEEDAFMESAKAPVTAVAPRTAEKIYREVMLGGGHINADMQQFLEWDRKVLRFYAIQDDLSTTTFERRPFVILYFLADDTVEIREMYPLNSGRDNFPIFFRRNKLPRGKVALLGPMEPAKKKHEHICATDFSVGRVHELLGYQFYVYDADPFTRQYFESELGQTLAERQDVRLPERVVARPKTPPYTGYGSWEDSMGSVTYLVPKVPKKDFKKLYENEGKILRFTARYHGGNPEDEDRLFVFNYHLFDDTLSIHEPPQRNTGIITGRYLEKAVHLNQNTGELFKPDDLQIGSIVKVYNREFEITDMDEYTRNYMCGYGNGRTYDLQSVLEKAREGMRQLFPLVRDIFRRMDTDHDGVLTQAEFKEGLAKWGFQVSHEEALILMKHFDTRQDGQVSYNEFCDALLDEDYTTEMGKTKPPLRAEYDPDYAARAQQKSEERQETEKVRAAARRLGDVTYKQIHAFTKLFKEFSRQTHLRTVTERQIVQALRQIGHQFSLEDVHRALLYILPDCDPENVDYVEFLKAITASYHDLAHVR
eukprot:TRINITY_DN1973_c0_g6_i1.p1 TRINITY_DN1973_c0_g6~~TRINITY_DN1973_c0_g6_i1.p1  ORF type:complete len:773 (+),score=190.71 TRINITY_DN1973_c0_g6_i1:80-2320(+)